MLGRRRERIFIIAGLIVLNILLGWFLGRLSKDYRNRTEWLRAANPPQPHGAHAPGSSQAAQPQSFVDIVDRNVFSPLRGTPPPQPPEEVKPPRPPLLSGTMNLGKGWFALMAPADQPSAVYRRVLPGEEIGGYKLVSIGTSSVVIQWQEKRITLDITEPSHRTAANYEAAAGASVRSAGSTSGVTTARSAVNPFFTSTAGPRSPNPQVAQPVVAPQVAPGTVVGGKRAVVVATPFGPVTQWVDVSPSASQPPQQTGGPNN